MIRVTCAIFFAAILFVCAGRVFAQRNRSDTATTDFITWEPIPEADILWRKIVSREINIYEQRNIAFRGYPDIPRDYVLADHLLKGIREGSIKAYANDSAFTAPLSPAEVESTLACNPGDLSDWARMRINYLKAEAVDPAIDTTGRQRKVMHFYDTTPVVSCKFPDQVERYGIREEWLFDKGRGQMVVRIIALAPMAFVNGKLKALFWLHYPEVRRYLALYEAWNEDENRAYYTWDEYFESRQFASKITKVSGPFQNTAGDKWMPESEKRKKRQ